MKKAIVFIANGSEEIEALTPVDYLRRAGVEVTLVGIGVTEGKNFVTCSHKVPIIVDSSISSYEHTDARKDCSALLSDIDAIIVPGGMPGATNIAEKPIARELIRLMNEKGRLVCSICASPAVVLPATGALEGKDWTCYPGMEQEAGTYSARYKKGVPFVHDKNLITGRGPGAAEEWSMEIVRTLCGDDVAKKVHDSSMQR